MKAKTFSAIGGWQSFLFCVGMYMVALFFSIFVCSAVFYAVNNGGTSSKNVAIQKTGAEREAMASVGK
ncbi:MAG: hypothetical protein JST47_14925 [Bacteroidetes bacterium]|nr:hypothetical protein [Bacteroidota bacterium]